MTTSEIIVTDNPAKSRFEATVDGQLAVAEYARRGDDMIIFTHTEVPAPLEGRGIANALARFALAQARREHRRVVPRCQFFASYIDRHPAEQDLLWRPDVDGVKPPLSS
jgi:predicted GNAT family acetyltransferase